MKIKGTKVIILIATILVGYLIVINFNLERNQSTLQLNAKEYQNLTEEKNRLSIEVNSLISDNRKIISKIENYDRGGDKTIRIIEDMKSQLSDYGMLTGLNEVKGPGVVIKINDGKLNYEEDNQFVLQNKLFHDNDTIFLLNEIRLSGGEAIAMNDYRITPNTGLECHWAFILSEDETDIYAPFSFYVIGDPEVLEATLMKDGSYLRILKARGLEVSIEKKPEIILKAANIRPLENAQEYINKK